MLRFLVTPVSEEGKIALNNIAPGRYWTLVQQWLDTAVSPLTKVRLPHESRTTLRRYAEAAKTEIEFKPCQNVVDLSFR